MQNRWWIIWWHLYRLMPVDTSLVIVGRNAVREALERNPASLEKVCLQRDARGLNRIRKLAARAGVPVRVLPQDGLRNLAGKVPHQGVLAVQAAFKYADYSEMLSAIAPNLDAVRAKRPRLLLLDGIEDPRNFGAVVRSAAAFGVRGMIVCSHHMAPVSTAMVKASSGTATRVPIARVERLADVIPELQERGYFVYGTAANADRSAWDVNWKCPIALVVGSENRGLYPDTERVCDNLIAIPLEGDVESLKCIGGNRHPIGS